MKHLHCGTLSQCGTLAVADEGAVTYSVMSHSPGWTHSGFEIVWVGVEDDALFLPWDNTQQCCCPNFPMLPPLLLLHLPVLLVTMVLSCLTVASFPQCHLAVLTQPAAFVDWPL